MRTARPLAALIPLYVLAATTGVAAEPLAVELPEEAFAHEGATIAVDINGYDVTGFASLADRTLLIELDPPLDPGEHTLTVLLFLPNDTIEVITDTTLEIPVPTGTDWTAGSTLQTDYRADEEPPGDFGDADGLSSSGSLAFDLVNTGPQLELGASVETIFDPYNEVADGDNWLLPGYYVSIASVNDSATGRAGAGTITVAREDLLFSRYERRGAEIAAVDRSGRFDIQAFTVSSTPRNAFDGDYVLPGDGRQRAGGLATTVVVLPGRLELAAGFVDGKSMLGGAGFNNPQDTATYGGSSWNVALDSRWLEDGLQLRFEQAESEFDSDGIGLGLPERRDDATRASLQLTSDGSIGAGPFDYWSATVQFQRVGRDFYSLGNLSMPGDLEVTSAFLQGGFPSLTIDVEAAREQTNAGDDPLLPTQTLDRAGITLSYSPASLDPDTRVWEMLGLPTVTGWFYRIDNSQPDSDALVAGFDVDNSTDETGLAVAFNRETLTWSIEHNVVDTEDSSAPVSDGGFLLYEPPSDSRNRQTSLSAAWYPVERISVEAWAQRNDFEETGFANRYRNMNYGLGSTLLLVPEKLSLSLTLNQARDRNTFGNPQFIGEEFRSRYASLQLNWFLRAAVDDRAGLSLYLNGSHGRNEDIAFGLDEESWSIYLGGTVSWAGSSL